MGISGMISQCDSDPNHLKSEYIVDRNMVQNGRDNILVDNIMLCDSIDIDFFINGSKLYFNYFYSSDNMH